MDDKWYNNRLAWNLIVAARRVKHNLWNQSLQQHFSDNELKAFDHLVSVLSDVDREIKKGK